jgi:hypothetical protein
MKKIIYLRILFTGFFLLTLISVSYAADLDILEGATVVASDAQFLGVVSRNTLASDSMSNDLGKYGSTLSSLSIFNTLGKYGSTLSALSPFNNLSSNPPRIILRDGRWAYFTVNELKTPRIAPYTVIGWMKTK